jgi:hypothetical protein
VIRPTPLDSRASQELLEDMFAAEDFREVPIDHVHRNSDPKNLRGSLIFVSWNQLRQWLRRWEAFADLRRILNVLTNVDAGYGQRKIIEVESVAVRYKGVRYMIHPGGWAGFKSFMLRFPDQRFTVIALSAIEARQREVRHTSLDIAS